MKSLIASLADSERMFRICLLLTKSDLFIAGIIPFSKSVGINTLFLSYFNGCLNSKIRLLLTRNFKKFCSSGSNKVPLSFDKLHILRI
jgi:hypothetical protein